MEKHRVNDFKQAELRFQRMGGRNGIYVYIYMRICLLPTNPQTIKLIQGQKKRKKCCIQRDQAFPLGFVIVTF